MAGAKNNLPTKVLVVDNDPASTKNVENILAKHDVSVMGANNRENAIYLFNQNKFALVMLAMAIDDIPGTTLIQKWRNHETESKRDTAYIVMTGQQVKSTDEQLIRELGDIFTIAKPFKEPVLLGILARAMQAFDNHAALSDVEKKVISPLLRQEKFDKAVELARSTLEPKGVKGKQMAVCVYDQAKKYDMGLNLSTTLHQEDEKNLRYVNDIGRFNMLLGNLDEATTWFEKADSLAPDNLMRLEDMAALYLAQQDPDKTVDKYREILRLNPEDKDRKFDMYERLQNAGFEQHARDFCKETSTPMDLIRHFNNKGVIFAKKAEYEAAIAEYRKAEKLIPGNKELYRIMYNEALAHINLKTKEHLEQAKELLEACLKIKPDYAKASEKLTLVEGYLDPKTA